VKARAIKGFKAAMASLGKHGGFKIPARKIARKGASAKAGKRA
jgi:hypothetical protein